MKKPNNRRLWIGIVLLTTLLVVPFISPVKQYLSIPDSVVTLAHESPVNVPTLGKNVTIDTSTDAFSKTKSNQFKATHTGKGQLVYKLAGLPIKKVNVSALKDVLVVPGGESIGVQLHTLGVLVVGYHLVKSKDGDISPGEEADIKVGDVLLKINGQKIEKMADVKPFVEKAGKNGTPMDITIKRNKKTIKTKLTPVKDKKEHDYGIGLYIRDSAAGIGTMTFYEPKSKRYGALGHVISDMDTQRPIQIHNGKIVNSTVTSIEKGRDGSPGEKHASFSVEDGKIGTIKKNTPFGIFGKLLQPISNGKYNKPIPIGLSHEVKEGPAKILTVLDGNKVQAFDIEIVSSIPQKNPATKGMIIKITDPKLLQKTGGIVQGMSGSPIIQDGKLIGAVTHVFVNDPTSGYGVHIEWMLQEAGVSLDPSNTKVS